MKQILILTGPEDLHAFAVREALVAKGGMVTLWNTPDFPSKSGESILFEGGTKTVKAEGPDLNLDNSHFDTVWRRRPSYAIDWSKIHPSDRKFVDIECNIFRRSMLGLIAQDAFWVNPADAAINAGYKMLQHGVASAVGFKTPDTLYSNDPKQIRAFIQRHGGEIIFKPLRGLSWQGEKSTWTSFTSRLTEAQLVEDDLLRSAPGIYQELISKAFELRVTAMGHCLLTAKISSQDTERGKLDWRRAPGEIKATPFDLPPRITDLCLCIMERLGIVFGCFDFIVTPEGDYVFLEVNEAGQFLFLEEQTGLPFLDRFSDFLLSGRPDFVPQKRTETIRFAEVLDAARAEIEKALVIHCPSPDAYSNDDTKTP
ncbi:MAG TPA: hypothetical protein VGG20_03385 [Thermoanaerobaculia bacterium]